MDITVFSTSSEDLNAAVLEAGGVSFADTWETLSREAYQKAHGVLTELKVEDKEIRVELQLSGVFRDDTDGWFVDADLVLTNRELPNIWHIISISVDMGTWEPFLDDVSMTLRDLSEELECMVSGLKVTPVMTC